MHTLAFGTPTKRRTAERMEGLPEAKGAETICLDEFPPSGDVHFCIVLV